jgi:hypothetical protein
MFDEHPNTDVAPGPDRFDPVIMARVIHELQEDTIRALTDR